MKKKMTYFAPETEQIVISFEGNYLASNLSSAESVNLLDAGDWD